MTCYSPVVGYATAAGGQLVFSERRKYDIVREVSVPCGQCLGCRLERSRQWAMRCMHESTLHEQNAFITLTYSDSNLPDRGQLIKRDFQLFMKRLRKSIAPKRVRFYMCGEYGPSLQRPHFHACLFGHDFSDRVYHHTTAAGMRLDTSEQLSKLWTYGLHSVGDVTFESAAYAARYCVQKVTGKNARFWYARVDENGEYQLNPEYNDMSRKPGIASAFLAKWKSDIYPHDYVVVNGQKVRPPKFYDRIFKREDPDAFEWMQWEREANGRKNYNDNTPERLLVKQTVKEAQIRNLKRNLSDL